jgi:hypothetical protein
MRQVFAIVAGILFGLVPLTGSVGLGLYFGACAQTQ